MTTTHDIQSAPPPPDRAQTDLPLMRIKPNKGWQALGLKELWLYRDLLWFLVWREIKGRYRQMALGPLWILIKPLVNMVIFSLIFGRLANLPSEGVPYPIFTYTALLPWSYFSEAASSATGSLRTRMNVISKVYFPRLIAPIAAILVGLADFGFSFLVLLGMMVFYGVRPTWAILTLPLYLLFAAATGLGIGLWLAGIGVRFRDLAYGVNYGLQVWMWATPVAYSAILIPEQWQFLYRLNPMYWVIEGFRWSLLGTGSAPQPIMLIPITLVLILLISGAFIFRRAERTVVDWQ